LEKKGLFFPSPQDRISEIIAWHFSGYAIRFPESKNEAIIFSELKTTSVYEPDLIWLEQQGKKGKAVAVYFEFVATCSITTKLLGGRSHIVNVRKQWFNQTKLLAILWEVKKIDHITRNGLAHVIATVLAKSNQTKRKNKFI